MSYLVLARKYRPSSFESVSGQEHVTRTLANAIKRGKIAHAYLFCGLRGVGKTSIARIFAKALNCVEGPTVTPCGVCPNCREIADGTSLAVREIDGASHNSVDNVRDLIDSFRSLPPLGSRNKIYIIDEVHMLSIAAFNALLKSLEEPPPNTIFILATTDPQKIPQTVISRCQRYDFRSLSFEEIQDCLKKIADKEGLIVEPEVFRMVARLAEGSMRDAQSLFDRVQSFCENTVTVAEAGQVLGVVDKNVLLRLSQAIFQHNSESVIEVVEQAFSTGLDPALFLKEFATHWRELLLAKFGGEKALLDVGISKDAAQDLLEQVKDVSKPDIQDLTQLGREGADHALRSLQPKYALEALVIRMANRENVREIEDLMLQLRNLIGSGRIAANAVDSVNSAQKKTLTSEAAYGEAVRRVLPNQERVVDNRVSEQQVISEAKPANKIAGRVMSWAGFVSSVKSPVMSEQLRRLSIVEFSLGKLVAKGPDFNVAYLTRTESLEKLQTCLFEYSQQRDWQISITAGVTDSESLCEQEEKKNLEHKQQMTQHLREHASVKAILDAFPSSKIDRIKVKE